MAREFATSEIIRQKCSICGMNNKKYTELVYDGETVGYKLTCCNCNHVNTFINNSEYIATNVYNKGREICIHLTTCKNKTCQYYGKYPLWTSAMHINDILNNNENINNPTCPNNCTCGCNQSDITLDEIKFSNTAQLDINGYEINEPKFH